MPAARIAALLWCLACGAALARADDKFRLEEAIDDTRVFGVGLRLDVNGKVQTRGDDNKPLDLPLHAAAAISYRERRLVGIGAGAETLRAVRDYEQAQVDIEISEEKTQVRLPDALKLSVVQGQPGGLDVYSLGGAFSAQELDLLTPPCDSLGLTTLLPRSEVAVGEEWSPASWVAQFLARLEAASKAEMKCRLVSVQNEVAKISFAGQVTGAAQGAPSEVRLEGTVDYDLKTKSIVSADVQQTEKRAIGAVSVGLDVAARLRLLRKPAQVPGRVAHQTVLDAAAADPPPTALALRFESPWGFSLLHGRQWHLFKQTEQVAILRLLDEGLFVAQCNLAPIAAAKPGGHTSPEVFQNDVRQALGGRLKTLGEPERIPTKDGRHVFRVVAQGEVGERKLTWIYYLCADPTGKQASLLFSLDTDLVEKLGERDRELVHSLRFGAPAVTAILRTPPQ